MMIPTTGCFHKIEPYAASRLCLSDAAWIKCCADLEFDSCVLLWACGIVHRRETNFSLIPRRWVDVSGSSGGVLDGPCGGVGVEFLLRGRRQVEAELRATNLVHLLRDLLIGGVDRQSVGGAEMLVDRRVDLLFTRFCTESELSLRAL